MTIAKMANRFMCIPEIGTVSRAFDDIIAIRERRQGPTSSDWALLYVTGCAAALEH